MPFRARSHTTSGLRSPVFASSMILFAIAYAVLRTGGGPPKIIEKLSHNFAATRNFLLIGGSFGRNAYLNLVPDHNAIGCMARGCSHALYFVRCLATLNK